MESASWDIPAALVVRAFCLGIEREPTHYPRSADPS